MTDREKDIIIKTIEKYEKFVEDEQDFLDNASLNYESELNHKYQKLTYQTIAKALKGCLQCIESANIRELENKKLQKAERKNTIDYIVRMTFYILFCIALLAYFILH